MMKFSTTKMFNKTKEVKAWDKMAEAAYSREEQQPLGKAFDELENKKKLFTKKDIDEIALGNYVVGVIVGAIGITLLNKYHDKD